MNVSQVRVSVQESVEHTTGCGEDVMLVPTPNGPVCVDVPQDVLVHGGAGWTSPPDSRQDVLLVAGASSRQQDTPLEARRGQYNVIGEVVHTSRISEALPDGSLLIIYDMQYKSDLHWDAMADSTRQTISESEDELQSALRSDLNSTYVSKAENSTTTGPVARVEYSPTSPSVNETVTFDASGSTVSEGEIQTFEWDLDGDGTIDASGNRVNVTFASAGDHAVTLTVTGTSGETNSTNATVSVSQKTASPVDVIAGPDQKPSLTEVQRGIQLWASGDPVPGTGSTLSLSDVQGLIQAWANDRSIGD
jgi:hypothetical protein